ncbi:MAG: ABC transporter transmembrane domain-containing protein, partial [Sphingobium sp.]
MPPDQPKENLPVPPIWATLRRFLPYLWPRDAPSMRRRVLFAVLLMLVGKLVSFSMPFAYKAGVDRMVPGMEPGVAITVALIVAYAGARFGNALFENLRNIAFESVGQEATRNLSEHVFRHLHRLSLRFHLDRKTGGVT